MSATIVSSIPEPIGPRVTTEADGTPGASNLAPARPGPRSLIGGITVPVDLIGPDPAQPRKTFAPDDLDRLARSMQQYGQMVPILVKTVAGTDRYIIIDGEQRWRAATRAGDPSVLDCKVESGFNVDPDGALERQLVTNSLRVEIRPVEQADAFRRLMDSQGLTQQQLADRLGIRQSDVSRSLSLLNLDPAVRRAVDQGDIAASTAVEIGKVKDPSRQRELADQAKDAGLTKGDVARRASNTKPSRPKDAKPARGRPLTGRDFKKMVRSLIETPKVKRLGSSLICGVLAEIAAEVREAAAGDEAEPAESPA